MATLRLHNTLTRTKEEFRPLDPTNVRMYVCGPTVYDYAHIGNARPVIVFDVLFRLLRHLYGVDHVTYVRNITDVDDKINARAFERWTRKRPLTQEIRALTDGTLAQFHKDVDALGALRPTHEPRATDFVANGAEPTDMIRIIARLIERGHAYEAEGHVLFHVPSMPDYVKLSRRNHDDMIAGARVDVAPYKRDPMDFVLWKPSNPETEPGWESPWGYGRPGWHIECSAMSGALLGTDGAFDIHAGGLDLIFPHHENEIAQTCCAFGLDRMASVWLHNGFLQVEGEKMSKSLGNFVTINELLTTDKFGGRSWPGEVLRLAMLKTHYRQPIDWTVAALREAEWTLRKWHTTLRGCPNAGAQFSPEVVQALSDDLNTPKLISIISGYNKTAMTFTGDFAENERAAGAIKGALLLLGIPLSDEGGAVPLGDIARITQSLKMREVARAAKNWAESDRIRDELLAMGIALKDNKDGTTTWEVKR